MDKLYQSIFLPLDVSYDELVQLIIEKLFPEGVNEVVGHISKYNVSVNAANSILNSLSDDFTIRKYVATKMLWGSGTVRTHLLILKTRSSQS